MTLIFAEKVSSTRWADNSVRKNAHFVVITMTMEMVGNLCGKNHTKTVVATEEVDTLPSELKAFSESLYSNLEGGESSLLKLYWIAKAIQAVQEGENPLPVFTDVKW
jgi:hypothetical protein